ncbi:MAG: hypothetical protein HY655_06770, partial [Acidobacteria bacterium]|nr:hypothetical protein [Acidobacteriota bacterium]
MTRIFAAAAFVLFASETPHGQSPAGEAPIPITLQDAIDRGLAASHRLA